MDIGHRSLRLWRASVILSVCFADFLRFSEVAFVRLEDLTVLEKKCLLECGRRRITVQDSMCVYLWTRSGAIALVHTLLSTLKRMSGGRRGIPDFFDAKWTVQDSCQNSALDTVLYIRVVRR
jgi:hypothetical protein